MRETIIRSLSGIVFIALVSALCMQQPFYLSLLCMLIVVTGINELYQLIHANGIKANFLTKTLRIFFLLFALLMFGFMAYQMDALTDNELIILSLLHLIFLILAMVSLYNNLAFKFLVELGPYVLVGLYLILPAFLWLNSIQHLDAKYNGWYALGLFVIIWSSDTFAYVWGRLLGKRKLFESVSPKKTWEGSIGGALSAVLAALLLAHFTQIFSYAEISILTVAVVVFGNYGDLWQSKLKRRAGVKDSGCLIPGHGGSLDRFDAFLFALGPYTILLNIFLR